MKSHKRIEGALIVLIVTIAAGSPGLGADRVAAPAAPFPDIAAALDAFAQAAREEENVPGLAFAVVKDDQVVLSKGYGLKTTGVSSGPVTDQTVFEIASTTKAFTAALVAMLVEDGKLAWNDPVTRHLPDFRMYDPWVTHEMRVIDLLCQRSGMPPYSLDQLSLIGFGRGDVSRAIRHVEPVTSFRNTFGYQNSLWIVAGHLLEAAGGHTWEDMLNQRILGPLGMRDSTVDPEIVPVLPDAASGHFDLGHGLEPIPAAWRYRHWIEINGPAASLRSNVLDMAKWARFHLGRGTFEGKQLLQPATVDLLHSSRTYMSAATLPGASSVRLSYALGWVREERRDSTIVWHNGGAPGQHSIVALYPEANAALIVLTNSPDNLVPERMKQRLFELMYPSSSESAALVADLQSFADGVEPAQARRRAVVRPLAAAPPLPLSRYTGDYENPAYGRFEVREKKGGLIMVMGPARIEGTLSHYSGNVWTLGFPDLPRSLFGGKLVTFILEPGKPARQFIAEEFADVRKGTFVRVE